MGFGKEKMKTPWILSRLSKISWTEYSSLLDLVLALRFLAKLWKENDCGQTRKGDALGGEVNKENWTKRYTARKKIFFYMNWTEYL